MRKTHRLAPTRFFATGKLAPKKVYKNALGWRKTPNVSVKMVTANRPPPPCPLTLLTVLAQKHSCFAFFHYIM